MDLNNVIPSHIILCAMQYIFPSQSDPLGLYVHYREPFIPGTGNELGSTLPYPLHTVPHTRKVVSETFQKDEKVLAPSGPRNFLRFDWLRIQAAKLLDLFLDCCDFST